LSNAEGMQMKSTNDLFKEAVILMHGECCVLCGAWAATVHHLYEKGIGGCDLNREYNPLNGVPICGMHHEEIHSVIGEVAGREKIFNERPLLREHTYKTHPLSGETEREVRAELTELIKQLKAGS
jgi:hypothetical protein